MCLVYYSLHVSLWFDSKLWFSPQMTLRCAMKFDGLLEQHLPSPRLFMSSLAIFCCFSNDAVKLSFQNVFCTVSIFIFGIYNDCECKVKTKTITNNDFKWTVISCMYVFTLFQSTCIQLINYKCLYTRFCGFYGCNPFWSTLIVP